MAHIFLAIKAIVNFYIDKSMNFSSLVVTYYDDIK